MSINRLVVVVPHNNINKPSTTLNTLIMNNMYAMVLFLVIMSTSSTLCVSSNNDGDHDIFMVTDDQTTMHDAGIGMSKVRYMHVLDCS